MSCAFVFTQSVSSLNNCQLFGLTVEATGVNNAHIASAFILKIQLCIPLPSTGSTLPHADIYIYIHFCFQFEKQLCFTFGEEFKIELVKMMILS